MKKQLLFIMVLFVSALSRIHAQQILNGDFNAYGQLNGSSTTFDFWSGAASLDSINGSDAVKLESSLSYFQSEIPMCKRFDPFTGKCIEYGNSLVTVLNSQAINQTVEGFLSIPVKLKGKYIFDATAGLSSQITIDGYYYGRHFFGNLVIDQSSPNVISFEIPIDHTQCVDEVVIDEVIIDGPGPIKKRPQGTCSDQNYAVVTVKSCLTCPNANQNQGVTKLIVDDLVFSNVALAIEKAKDISTIIVYPNPANTEINTQEFVEILDVMGNKVAEGQGRIDVSSLSNGVYYLKSVTGVAKIIKE